MARGVTLSSAAELNVAKVRASLSFSGALRFEDVCRILIMTANEMHYFSDLFDKVLYMFRTCPLSIRSISTLYTRNGYLSC